MRRKPVTGSQEGSRQNLTLGGGILSTFTNSGTVQAIGGGILSIAPNSTWTNSGTVGINAGTANPGGTFNAAGGDRKSGTEGKSGDRGGRRVKPDSTTRVR